MTSDPAARELAQPPRAKRGSLALRVIVAAAAIAAVVWYVRSRNPERTISTVADRSGSGMAGEGAGGSRQGGPPYGSSREDLPLVVLKINPVEVF